MNAAIRTALLVAVTVLTLNAATAEAKEPATYLYEVAVEYPVDLRDVHLEGETYFVTAVLTEDRAEAAQAYDLIELALSGDSQIQINGMSFDVWVFDCYNLSTWSPIRVVARRHLVTRR